MTTASTTSLRNIALFGAGGNKMGHHILNTLLTPKYASNFTVTVIARESSKTAFPSSVTVLHVPDSLPHDDLVRALRKQDVLISTIGYPAKLSEFTLIDAAIEAGVKRFIPSEYGLDNSNPAAQQLSTVFALKGRVQRYLQSKESTGLTWTAIPTGMWLEWALTPAISFLGINIAKHSAEYVGDGTHKLSFSTLPYAAEGVAQILLHPSQTANKTVPVRAFEASLVDIVAHLEKEQQVKYTVTNIDSEKFIAENQASVKAEEATASDGIARGAAIYALIRAGFVLQGYGSNLVTETKAKVSSQDFEMPELKIEDVVRKAVASAAQ
ncbi:uncharacterized protein AB675_7512 [Cyphellophora attinorum]|uniref:NmrA-like domain-containing protein n=1 Tax=Cyphellophora attinorum TaxID=1664694 RepID=A0A0N1HB78_9EURO|nr:uncharacterized protein AB675_7512 [Phialophora attinorum]KPI40346.1 hypothetical protein AB675_7512 [Phialophora attinorum]